MTGLSEEALLRRRHLSGGRRGRRHKRRPAGVHHVRGDGVLGAFGRRFVALFHGRFTSLDGSSRLRSFLLRRGRGVGVIVRIGRGRMSSGSSPSAGGSGFRCGVVRSLRFLERDPECHQTSRSASAGAAPLGLGGPVGIIPGRRGVTDASAADPACSSVQPAGLSSQTLVIPG